VACNYAQVIMHSMIYVFAIPAGKMSSSFQKKFQNISAGATILYNLQAWNKNHSWWRPNKILFEIGNCILIWTLMHGWVDSLTEKQLWCRAQISKIIWIVIIDHHNVWYWKFKYNIKYSCSSFSKSSLTELQLAPKPVCFSHQAKFLKF
jgi:hypothetical protein